MKLFNLDNLISYEKIDRFCPNINNTSLFKAVFIILLFYHLYYRWKNLYAHRIFCTHLNLEFFYEKLLFLLILINLTNRYIKHEIIIDEDLA